MIITYLQALVIVIIFICFLCIFAISLDILMDRDIYDCFKISFNQFRKFYELNPDDYALHEYVALRYERDVYPNKWHTIGFNLIDTFRYIHFRHKVEKAEKTDYSDRRKLEYIKSVQKDIDSLNKQAKEEINKAKEGLSGKYE